MIYTFRFSVAEQFSILGLIAIPFGCTIVSSIIETTPVEGRKRYEAEFSCGAVSVKALNQEYSVFASVLQALSPGNGSYEDR